MSMITTGLIILLPIISGLTISFTGRSIGQYGASWIACLCICFAALCSYLTLYIQIRDNITTYYFIYDWIQTGEYSVSFELVFDLTSTFMCVIILTISAIVHIYSTDYLRDDPHLPRYFMELSFFTFFMIFLVLSQDLLQLFIGWEGVGVCSYLLINFWYTRVQANKSALKAIYFNKIGDLAFLLAIGLIMNIYGSTKLTVINILTPTIANQFIDVPFLGQYRILEVIGILLFIAAIGKSAQIGLHAWLPDAMEGPTPVSALLHAATMVTAGVFLLIRCLVIFNYTIDARNLVLFFGLFTSIFAGTLGTFQYDIKRIIAYSTCSQIGYMFFACGLGQPTLALFHLYNHAFFKALLFLAAGNIIHAMHGEQDIRRMGGLANHLPLTMTFFLIGSISLMGIPPLSGFYSKEAIVNVAMTQFSANYKFFTILSLFSICLTTWYTIRTIFYIFLWKPRFPYIFYFKNLINEPELYGQIGLILLALMSIFSGLLTYNLFTTPFSILYFNSPEFFNSLKYDVKVYPDEFEFLESQFSTIWFILPLLTTIIVSCISFYILSYLGFNTRMNCFSKFKYYYELYIQSIHNPEILGKKIFLVWIIKLFLAGSNSRGFFDNLLNNINVYLLTIMTKFYKIIDKGFLERYGPTGISIIPSRFSFKILKITQSGELSRYIKNLIKILVFIIIIYSLI